jgi:hypothetical protein
MLLPLLPGHLEARSFTLLLHRYIYICILCIYAKHLRSKTFELWQGFLQNEPDTISGHSINTKHADFGLQSCQTSNSDVFDCDAMIFFSFPLHTAHMQPSSIL